MKRNKHQIRTREGFDLGTRDYSGINMMAGYTSDAIHAKSMEVLKRYLPVSSVVLDLGAGQGAFSLRLHKAGYQVSGIEKYAEFLAEQIPRFALDLNSEWADQVPAPFDSCDGLVAIEVIEHLDNPYHFFRKCHQVLKPGGYLLITSPNVESMISRWKFLFFGKIEMLEHKTHRTPILRQTIERLCDQGGFKLVYHTYDVDMLDYSKSFHKLMVKKLAKWFTHVIVRDRRNLSGVSNIWLFQKLS